MWSLRFEIVLLCFLDKILSSLGSSFWDNGSSNNSVFSLSNLLLSLASIKAAYVIPSIVAVVRLARRIVGVWVGEII